MHNQETVAKVLGYAGLIPFVVFSIGAWLPLPFVGYPVDYLVAYAAVILAFMGAIHWGAAMAGPKGMRARYLVASVIPALVAWITLLLPQSTALLVLLAGFVSLYAFDRATSRLQDFPDWYVPMRLRLTTVVALCLVIALVSIQE
jgi:hypothetical protein